MLNIRSHFSVKMVGSIVHTCVGITKLPILNHNVFLAYSYNIHYVACVVTLCG